MEDDLKKLKMEDDLNFLKIEDDLKFLVNVGQPQKIIIMKPGNISSFSKAITLEIHKKL